MGTRIRPRPERERPDDPIIPPPVTPPRITPVSPTTPVRQIGPLSVETWRAVLASASSPMLPEVDAIVAAAGEHGAMALAQAYKESSLGKDTTAQQTHNAWGIMSFGGAHPCLPIQLGLCLRKFNTWADGAATFRRIISDASPPYDPQDIDLRSYLQTYVGGPDCRRTNYGNCANGEGRDSIELYLRQTIERINQWRNQISPPPVAGDPIATIMGGRATDTSYGYKSPAAAECRNCYSYFEGHGGRADQHTGIDATSPVGEPLYTPAAGVVTCAGTGNGPGSWGTGCAAFPDYFGRGAGRVEILLDSGVSLILGHSSESLVRQGQRVEAGQKVATSGGMNGPHVHIETRERGCDVYCITDPRKSLGGSVTPPPPLDLPPWLSRAQLEAAFPPLAQYGPGSVTKLLLTRIKATGRLPVMVRQFDVGDTTITAFSDGYTVFSRGAEAWEAGTE